MTKVAVAGVCLMILIQQNLIEHNLMKNLWLHLLWRQVDSDGYWKCSDFRLSFEIPYLSRLQILRYLKKRDFFRFSMTQPQLSTARVVRLKHHKTVHLNN